MNKCPRCEVLLLDTDTECPRCGMPVEATASVEETRQKRRKELRHWKKRHKSDAEKDDSIPLWLPPVSVPLSAAAQGFYYAVGGFRVAGEFNTTLLGFMTVIVMGLIVANALLLFVSVWIVDGERPAVDRSLFAASMMVFLPGTASFLLSFIPFFTTMLLIFVRMALIYAVIQGLFEISKGKATMVLIISALILIGGSMTAYTMLANSILQQAGAPAF
jgi:hypothetical protein